MATRLGMDRTATYYPGTRSCPFLKELAAVTDIARDCMYGLAGALVVRCPALAKSWHL